MVNFRILDGMQIKDNLEKIRSVIRLFDRIVLFEIIFEILKSRKET